MVKTYFILLLLVTLTASTGLATSAYAAVATPSTNALRDRALSGDADAQLQMGGLFIKGQTVERDYEEAGKWFRLAAAQGQAQAQYNLGMMYASGRGAPLDHGESARWYRLAADQGLDLAQLNLGVAYANGAGVPQDESEAAKWFRLAANHGEAQAQFNLAVLYANGQGVLQNLAEARHWAMLAADQGHQMAQALINDLDQKMTPPQQARAHNTTPPLHTQSAALHEQRHYYVQLGAFKSQQLAADFMADICAKPSHFDKPCMLFNNRGWVRIHLGPYPDMNEARRSADRLKTRLGHQPKIRQH